MIPEHRRSCGVPNLRADPPARSFVPVVRVFDVAHRLVMALAVAAGVAPMGLLACTSASVRPADDFVIVWRFCT